MEEIFKRVESNLKSELKTYDVKLLHDDISNYLYIIDGDKIKNIFNLDMLYRSTRILNSEKLTKIILYCIVGK
jgi:hypothetical protein